MSDNCDWEQESDYARYVLRGPTYGQLLEKADEDRKRAKEEGENPHYGPGNPDWERDFEKTREDE